MADGLDVVSGRLALLDVQDGVAALNTLRPSQMDAEGAAMHIGALHRMAALVHQMLEAQVMEACHRIRSVAPERLDELVRRHTPLTPAQAHRHADCWAAARGNRAVMDLANDRPNEALRLVADVKDAMDAGAITDDVGREVARVVALPRAQRVLALRGLVEARDAAAAGRSPEDAARIAALEEDVEALEGERAAWMEATTPGRAWREVEDAVRGAADALDDARARMERLGTAPDTRRLRLLHLLDAIGGAADAASAALAGEAN